MAWDKMKGGRVAITSLGGRGYWEARKLLIHNDFTMAEQKGSCLRDESLHDDKNKFNNECGLEHKNRRFLK